MNKKGEKKGSDGGNWKKGRGGAWRSFLEGKKGVVETPVGILGVQR